MEQNAAGVMDPDSLGAAGYIWRVTGKLTGFLFDRDWRNALWESGSTAIMMTMLH